MKFSVISVLSAALISGCAAPDRFSVPVRPERWDAEFSISAGFKSRFLVQIHDYGRGFTEFVIRRGAWNKPPLSCETLYVGSLSQDELTLLYDSVVETLRRFEFTGEQAPILDGGTARVELRIGGRSLTAGFSSFAGTKELPRSVQRIMQFADARLAKRQKPKTKNS